MTPEQVEGVIAWMERQCMAAAKLAANDPSPDERARAKGASRAHRACANRLRLALTGVKP